MSNYDWDRQYKLLKQLDHVCMQYGKRDHADGNPYAYAFGMYAGIIQSLCLDESVLNQLEQSVQRFEKNLASSG